jgi:hypothetical protein
MHFRLHELLQESEQLFRQIRLTPAMQAPNQPKAENVHTPQQFVLPDLAGKHVTERRWEISRPTGLLFSSSRHAR